MKWVRNGLIGVAALGVFVSPAIAKSAIQEQFERADQDGDGVLSLDEWMYVGVFECGYTYPEAEGYFQNMDRNHDGVVSGPEYSQGSHSA